MKQRCAPAKTILNFFFFLTICLVQQLKNYFWNFQSSIFFPQMKIWDTFRLSQYTSLLIENDITQDYHIIWGNASNKSCSALNSVQKSEWVHLSIYLEVELGGPKGCRFWNIIMYKNGKVDSVWGSMLPKIRIISHYMRKHVKY